MRAVASGTGDCVELYGYQRGAETVTVGSCKDRSGELRWSQWRAAMVTVESSNGHSWELQWSRWRAPMVTVANLNGSVGVSRG